MTELRAALEHCGRYELAVQAAGQWLNGVGGYGDLGVNVEVPIRLTFEGSDVLRFFSVGEAPPTAVRTTFVDNTCQVLDAFRPRSRPSLLS
jgi:hypothetical protein